MNFLRSHLKNAALLLGLCGIAALLTGCGAALQDEPTFSDTPVLTGSKGAVPTAALSPSGSEKTNVPIGRFRVGDTVLISFSGVDPNVQPAPYEGRITDDGTITLHLIGSVVATGKTPGELQKEIHDLYVPKHFTHLVVTVRGIDLYYYAGGEVRNPGKQIWTGELRVTQAIQACGDFTDFANKKNVQLIRSDGTMVKVNCVEALKDPKKDPNVLPGDTIKVHRRLW